MQSYKLFYNNVRLLVARYEQNYQTKTCPENCFLFKNIAKNTNLTVFLKKFLTAEQNFDLLYANEMEEKQIKKALYSFFVLKRAAGGIVLKDDAILRIFRLNCWDFPKGHIEAGETDADAALREVTEETGIDELSIEKDLGYTYHIFTNENNDFVLKETHWYQMRTTSQKTLIPQMEESILAAEWILFAHRNLIVENTYPSLVELLSRLY